MLCGEKPRGNGALDVRLDGVLAVQRCQRHVCTTLQRVCAACWRGSAQSTYTTLACDVTVKRCDSYLHLDTALISLELQQHDIYFFFFFFQKPRGLKIRQPRGELGEAGGWQALSRCAALSPGPSLSSRQIRHFLGSPSALGEEKGGGKKKK